MLTLFEIGLKIAAARVGGNAEEIAKIPTLMRQMYNLGWPRLKTFVKMIEALKDEDYLLAAAEMLDSKWHSQVKGRAEELAELMKTGSNEKEI